ncbi:MAG: hypothetical protein M5U12_37955 [Verrucomicrobia bacterium]|nr:hypothetical protein [Verrucomicrobiota bacterium]
MADFLAEVHGGPVKVLNPFWTMTKADVFTLLDKVNGRNLISSAVSCSKTFQRLPGNATHCGCCFQCVDRRIAAYAAGLQEIDNAGIYSADIFTRRIEVPETRTTALDYVRQAVSFSKASDDGFVLDRLAELSDVTPFIGLDEENAVDAVWKLCQRHGAQVLAGLDAVRKQFDDLRFPLEKGSLLHLLSVRAHLGDSSQIIGEDTRMSLERIQAGINELKRQLLPSATSVEVPVMEAEGARDNTKTPEPPWTILSEGKLYYRPGFEDVWFDDAHYDLRERTKARLCIQYLVETRAFDAASARHLTEEIDPYVRERGDFPQSADIKIDHYFNDPHDPKKRLPGLRKKLIVAAGRDGRYFLKTN